MTRLAVPAMLLVGLATVSPAADPPRPKAGTLAVGDRVPDLAADLLGRSTSVKLADLRGKPTVLIFGSCT
jgi:hypothetical protein